MQTAHIFYHLVEGTGQMSHPAADPAVCQSPAILASPRFAHSRAVSPVTLRALQCPALKRLTATQRPQRHPRPPLVKYHRLYSVPHRQKAPYTVQPASRPFLSSFLRYKHRRAPYARTRPPYGVHLCTRHPTTRTNVPSAKKRRRNVQVLQIERKENVPRSQQVLPQRALDLKEITNGLHHVGRYPALEGKVILGTNTNRSAVVKDME